MYAESPEKQQRVLAENAQKSPLARLVHNGAYGFIYRYPELTMHILAKPYRDQGLEVIAFGRNSTAIRDGETVLKIARASERMPAPEQRKLVDELTYRHDASMTYLGAMCIDQKFEVIEHPLHNTTVVAGVQSFVDFEPFDSHAWPAADKRPSLSDFAEKSLVMEAETHLMTDVSGTNNFGFDNDDNLVLVDTIPMKSSDGGPSIDMARRMLNEMAVLAR